MSIDKAIQDFLWKLFHLVFVEGDQNRAAKEINSLYESGGELPSFVEGSLTTFWTSRNQSDVLDAAVTCAERLSFDPSRQTRLVAFLFKRKRLTSSHALACLSFSGVNTDSLAPQVQKVADVVWLLKQDSQRGAPMADDDDLLSASLLALAAEGLEPMTVDP